MESVLNWSVIISIIGVLVVLTNIVALLMDLRKCFFQLVKSEHCRISHHEREDHRGKHHIPHNSDPLDRTICKESAERQHQRNDHRQSIRRQLVPGYFLEYQ